MKRAEKKRAVMIRYTNGEFGIKITTLSRTDVTRIRSLSGRKRDPEGKYWTCPLKVDSVERLRKWGWDLHPALIAHLQKNRESVNDLSESSLEIPGLGMELFHYQKKGVEFIDTHRGRVLIADSMGLGKTAQALAWLQLHPEKRPAIIVVPASLKLNWEREAEMWMEDPGIVILSGRKPSEIHCQDIIIINYDILTNDYEKYEKRTISKDDGAELIEIKEREVPYTGWVDWLRDLLPKVVIADEAHYTKSSKAKRTKALRKLVRRVPHLICLTGTPIINRPIEFYNIIQMISPALFPNWWSFAHRYCAAKHTGFGLDTSGSSNEEELHDKLVNSIMIRRKKSEVMKDLPPKLYSFLPMELNNRREYREAEENFIEFIKRRKGAAAAERASNAESLTKLGALRRLAASGKMDNAVDWIRDVLDSGEKLVIMAVHKFVIDRLMGEFAERVVKVDGSVSGGKRQLAVDKFQNEPETRLFVGNIKAAGVGLTLTASSRVAFLELPDTPGALVQAADRVHRIGQKDVVNIYYLLAKGTIEEEIAIMLDDKRKVMEAVLDGKAPEAGSLLMDLINNYTDD